jgi:SpoVK/Ycf46/Vps4 family AAA+-type ATPase
LGKCTISKNGRPTDNLYFPPHISKLIHEVEMWRKLQTWYAERAIPWKRGWVLHGPPGTGKTAIARAIAEELDMPLFVYALGHMLDEELERSWAEMQAHIPCVALFEDFDNVFHGRENVYGKATLAEMLNTTGPTKDPAVAKEQTGILNIGRLSFDCLLNCLDGVEKSNGVFTIITTNHIDKLDEAMGRPRKNTDGTTEFISTRPGRIDKAIELTYMTDGDKLRLAKRIFFDNERSYHKMVALIEKEPNKQETPAQFQERCAQMALELLWKSEHEIEEKICSNGNHKFFTEPFSAANV